jgi:hypothetical protein
MPILLEEKVGGLKAVAVGLSDWMNGTPTRKRLQELIQTLSGSYGQVWIPMECLGSVGNSGHQSDHAANRC